MAFWLSVAVLCAIAIGVIVWPVWQQQRRNGRWSPVGLALAAAVAPSAVGLYLYVSNWDSEFAARASEGDRLVAELAERLERNPEDLDGWRLLANSYMALGRYEQGRAAYQEIWSRTPVPDNELKIAFAESQILTDSGSLTGDAGRLVEEVLAAQPGNPKALWYGGLVALELGLEDAVRSRWTSLLALNPPEQVANVIRTQLAALGGAPQSDAQANNAPTPVASGPSVKLSVTLGAGRSVAQLGPNAQLFIIARAPEGGPPIAVIRRPASAVPGEFTLSDANAMIQGRSLANYDELTLVTRLSASGQPTEQPGDWVAQTVFRPEEGGAVALVIDQVVQ